VAGGLKAACRNARVPIESDGRVLYRIKSAVEALERTAEESELTGIS
jgi:hypothetical protein